MDEIQTKVLHPKEIDLAWLSESDGAEGEMAEHLRWCGRCRSAVADHRWLQDEVSSVLAVAAEVVPVPRPRWWDVQEVLRANNQRRQARGWWTSAVASAVAAVCLMLAVSSMFGPAFGTVVAASQTAPPVLASVAAVATAPDVSLLTDSFLVATPTPVVFDEAREASLSPTPVLLLPPTPAQPEI